MVLSKMLSGYGLEAVLDSLVAHSWNSIMVTQAVAKTPIVYVNKAFSLLTGYTPDDVIGKSPELLQGPNTDPAVIEQLRQDLTAGRMFEGQTINYRKDGSEFLMIWRVFPIYDNQCKIIYFVAIQRAQH